MLALEELVMEILKQRLQGRNEDQIAETLNIDLLELLMAEGTAIRLLEDSVRKGIRGLQQVSQDTNLPIPAVLIYSSRVSLGIYKNIFGKRSYYYRVSRRQRVDAIRAAVELGAVSPDAVADAVGLTKETLVRYARVAGIDLPKPRSIDSEGSPKRIYASQRRAVECIADSEVRLDAVRQAVAAKLASIQDIAEQTGLVIHEVMDVSAKAGIDLPLQVYRDGSKVYTGRYDRAARINVISKALAEGVKSLEELCKRTYFGPHALRKFCEAVGIKLPDDLIPFKYRPELDVLIDQKLSVAEMESKAHRSGQTIRNYMKDSFQYNIWRTGRREVKSAAKRKRLKRDLKYYPTEKNDLIKKLDEVHTLYAKLGWKKK